MALAAPKPRVRVSTAGELRGAVVDGQVMRPRPSSAYMRGGQCPFFFNWNPARAARSAGRVSRHPFFLHEYKGPIEVAQWDNVRLATIVNDKLVPGALIPKP